MDKVAAAQVGGPTAVVNESLFGFLDEAAKDHEVYGVLDAGRRRNPDSLLRSEPSERLPTNVL